MSKDPPFECYHCGHTQILSEGYMPKGSWVDGAGYIIGTCGKCGKESVWMEEDVFFEGHEN